MSDYVSRSFSPNAILRALYLRTEVEETNYRKIPTIEVIRRRFQFQRLATFARFDGLLPVYAGVSKVSRVFVNFTSMRPIRDNSGTLTRKTSRH